MLKSPDTSKELEDGLGVSDRKSAPAGMWKFGVSSMRGWRLHQEDAHLALPDFDPARRLGLFGVFDGHGGAAVSCIVAKKLPRILQALPAYKQGRYSQALSEAYLKLDEYLDSAAGRKEVCALLAAGPGKSEDEEAMEDEEEEDEEEMDLDGLDDTSDEDWDGEDLASGAQLDGLTSNELWVNGEGPDCMGTTAVVALVRAGESPEVFCANAGDSRCVLARGESAIGLSHDHKPELRKERMRIKNAGGFIAEGRIDGNLNLSRALGDLAYKKNKKLGPTQQKISCEADVCRRALTKEDRYLVLGCDGIWEKASNQNVLDFLLKRLRKQRRAVPLGSNTPSEPPRLSACCSAFLDFNLARSPMADLGLGCDNMTLMMVDLAGTVNSLPDGEASGAGNVADTGGSAAVLRIAGAIGKKAAVRRRVVKGRRSSAHRRLRLLLAEAGRGPQRERQRQRRLKSVALKPFRIG